METMQFWQQRACLVLLTHILGALLSISRWVVNHAPIRHRKSGAQVGIKNYFADFAVRECSPFLCKVVSFWPVKYFVLGKKGNQPKNGLGLSDSSVSGWGQDYLTFQ